MNMFLDVRKTVFHFYVCSSNLFLDPNKLNECGAVYKTKCNIELTSGI